jgi:electron transport complex protein RnfB
MATEQPIGRRGLLRLGARGGLAAALLGSGATLFGRRQAAAGETVWQIDPDRCIWCGRCATECVLTFSAAKCMRDQPYCGYCEVCAGFQSPERIEDREQAENQICPTHAIQRVAVERNYPYYEYLIDEDKCIGCAKCCEGCARYGNGSMYMQVDHEVCVNCSKCSIAAACPAEAFVQVPAETPYYFRHRIEENLSPWASCSIVARQVRPPAGPAADPPPPAGEGEPP